MFNDGYNDMNGFRYDNSYLGQAMPQPMQTVRPMRISTLPGKIVKSHNDITPNDVPMDGSPSLFLQNDAQCIFLKAWGSDGLIKTVKYVPYVEETPAVATNVNNTDKYYEELTRRLDKIEELLTRKPTIKKKEDTVNE